MDDIDTSDLPSDWKYMTVVKLDLYHNETQTGIQYHRKLRADLNNHFYEWIFAQTNIFIDNYLTRRNDCHDSKNNSNTNNNNNNNEVKQTNIDFNYKYSSLYSASIIINELFQIYNS